MKDGGFEKWGFGVLASCTREGNLRNGHEIRERFKNGVRAFKTVLFWL